MLDHSTASAADRYWATHLGCSSDEMFAEPIRVLAHGGELADYWGVFSLFRENSVMISAPPDCSGEIRALLSPWPHGFSPTGLAAALEPFAARVIGPAFIGYSSSIPGPAHSARSLTPDDAPLLDALRDSCDPTEWEHGGSSIGDPASGIFVDGRLVALAGYEIWGGKIAHISVISHPDFRGRGFGRGVVAHVAGQALASGLIPQYRTLESNRSSIRIAGSLGFHHYATSVAVRLKVNAGADAGSLVSLDA